MKVLVKTFFLVLFASLLLTSCNDERPVMTGIPSDRDATANPIVLPGESNAVIPSAIFYEEGQHNIVNMALTGIQDPVTQNWLRLYGTNSAQQNVWVEVDGVSKGILVSNLASAPVTKGDPNLKMMADVIFLVDNSASMGEESEMVANQLTAWIQYLDTKGLDLQIGIVGFDAMGVNGSTMLLGSPQDAVDFLNRPGTSGRTRTVGFPHGHSNVGFTNTTNAECQVKALLFADANSKYRYGANRIFICLTDEPNQPLNDAQWSVDVIDTKWEGTVHVVYSDPNTTFAEIQNQKEYPWRLSMITGGTHKFTNPTYAGITLIDDFPVTGAMANSYRIQFVNTSAAQDGSHTIRLTVQSPDGSVAAERIYTGIQFAEE